MPDITTVQLDPLDTLFFKDGKPFSLGEETWADGIFPPPPSVIYGALRTALMGTKLLSGSLKDAVNETENLAISYIAYLLNGEEHFPIPLDVVELKDKPARIVELEKDNKEYEVFPLSITELPSETISSVNLTGLRVFPRFQENNFDTVEPIEKGFLTRDFLESYLRNPESRIKTRRLSDYLKLEAKTGIKRNSHTRSTSDEFGELYRVGMNRLSDFSFLVSWSLNSENSNPHLSSLLRFGAEGKVAESTPYRRRIWKGPQGISTERVKVYLATPCAFEDGLPNPEKISLLQGKGLKLVGLACGKPFYLGGFDMEKMEPKPMLKVYPAGTVFYLECSIAHPLDAFQGKSIASKINNIDYASQGFGIAYFGTW